MNQVIEVVVSSTGETKVQTQGFSGAACRQASRFVEEALGKLASEQLTAEFYQNQAVSGCIKERQQ